MSADKKTPMENLMDCYLQELLSMPDKEVLGGANPASLKAEAHRMLDAAKAAAGRQRLALAKARIASRPKITMEQPSDVSVSEARAYLKKAANDSRFTLAARELEDMSDDDAMALYQQIRFLEESDDEAEEE